MIEARYTLDETPLIELRARAAEALSRVAVHVWTAVQTALNVPNTGVRRKRLHGRGSYTVYPNPSQPGEPPRKRTGWLQRHVLYDIDRENLTARIGLAKNADYGIHLEVGTRQMAARPWLYSTAQSCAGAVRRILESALGTGTGDRS